MAKPPPDPLFVFHDRMDSVFCLLFVLEESTELVYAGTGDGSVHIWDLEDNRRLKINKIGDNTCLQLHRTPHGIYITQEKSGPVILWQESTSRDWNKCRTIPSSYVGFCRSVLTQDVCLILPCSESTLKVIGLQNVGNKVVCQPTMTENTGRSVVCKLEGKLDDELHEFGASDRKLDCESGDNEKSIICDNGGTSFSELKVTGKTVCEKLGENPLHEFENTGKTSLQELGDTTSHESRDISVCDLEGHEKIRNNDFQLEIGEEYYLSCEKGEKLGEVMALKTYETFLLAVYESGELKLWCLSTRKCLARLNLNEKFSSDATDCPMTLDYDEKFCRGIVGSSSAELIEFSVLKTVSYQLVKNRTVSMTNPGASCVRIRADGKIFVVGCWDGRIRLYSCKSLKLLLVLDCHRRKTVQDVVFASGLVKSWSSDRIFASGGLDGRLCLWSVY